MLVETPVIATSVPGPGHGGDEGRRGVSKSLKTLYYGSIPSIKRQPFVTNTSASVENIPTRILNGWF